MPVQVRRKQDFQGDKGGCWKSQEAFFFPSVKKKKIPTVIFILFHFCCALTGRDRYTGSPLHWGGNHTVQVFRSYTGVTGQQLFNVIIVYNDHIAMNECPSSVNTEQWVWILSPRSPIVWPTRALGEIWEENGAVSVVWLLPIWKLFLSEASRPFAVKNCYLPSLGANWDCMCRPAHSWQMARSPTLPYAPLFSGKARAHEQIWLVRLWPWVSLKPHPYPWAI